MMLVGFLIGLGVSMWLLVFLGWVLYRRTPVLIVRDGRRLAVLPRYDPTSEPGIVLLPDVDWDPTDGLPPSAAIVPSSTRWVDTGRGRRDTTAPPPGTKPSPPPPPPPPPRMFPPGFPS